MFAHIAVIQNAIQITNKFNGTILNNKAMTLQDKKREMAKYLDFYGGDLLGYSDIEKAKTKADLSKIIEEHRSHMEMMLCDANAHLDNFKKRIGLTN